MGASMRTRSLIVVGKTLPEEIDTAHHCLMYARSDIDDARRRLLEQADALHRLLHCDSLTERQRAMIEDLGFGYCLVPPVASQVTQGEGVNHA